MDRMLVAVDGSDANRAALAWALDEAERTGAALTIATVADLWQITGPFPGAPPPLPETDFVQPIADLAADAARERLGEERVAVEVRAGHPVRVLLDLAEGHTVLVIGKRGQGALRRVVIGSTSIAVAGRSPIPVVVVPDPWDQAAAAGRPVLVGMDMDKEHDAALGQAFTQASRRDVELQVLQGWVPHPLLVGEATVATPYYTKWAEHCYEQLEAYVERARADFPDVTVTIDQAQVHPVDLLTERSELAQLLVLGRDPKERWSGFTLGSVARGVLHHSHVPVAVVPAD